MGAGWVRTHKSHHPVLKQVSKQRASRSCFAGVYIQRERGRREERERERERVERERETYIHIHIHVYRGRPHELDVLAELSTSVFTPRGKWYEV